MLIVIIALTLPPSGTSLSKKGRYEKFGNLLMYHPKPLKGLKSAIHEDIHLIECVD
jgi:hypothetical protein